MICAFDQFPMAHQRRKRVCAFKLGALGKNLKAQARSFRCFSMAHQRRKRGSAALRCRSACSPPPLGFSRSRGRLIAQSAAHTPARRKEQP